MEAPRPQQRESLHLACVFFVLVVLSLFAFGSYIAFEKPQESETAITGAATADEAFAPPSAGTQIGIYKITPSFAVLEDRNIVAEYDTLQKDIRSFHSAVEDCTDGEIETVEKCVDEILAQEAYSSWLLGEDCETPEETLFYDVTELFRQCGASVDTDCTCVGQFTGTYDEREYAFFVSQDAEGIHFSLDDLTVLLPALSLAIEGTALVSDTYTVAVSGSDVFGSFSALEPSSTLYLYKQRSTLSVESESTFTLSEGTRSTCAVPEAPTFKFCKQSATAVPVYDSGTKKIIQQPIVYLFALDFLSE